MTQTWSDIKSLSQLILAVLEGIVAPFLKDIIVWLLTWPYGAFDLAKKSFEAGKVCLCE